MYVPTCPLQVAMNSQVLRNIDKREGKGKKEKQATPYNR